MTAIPKYFFMVFSVSGWKLRFILFRELGGHFRAARTQTGLQARPTFKAITPGYNVLGLGKPSMEIELYDIITVSVQSGCSEIVSLQSAQQSASFWIAWRS
jgi:hypothetical protein